jgi:hypothetical protein
VPLLAVRRGRRCGDAPGGYVDLAVATREQGQNEGPMPVIPYS